MRRGMQRIVHAAHDKPGPLRDGRACTSSSVATCTVCRKRTYAARKRSAEPGSSCGALSSWRMWSPVIFLTTSLSDRNEEAYSCGFGGAPVQSAERRLRTETCAEGLC